MLCIIKVHLLVVHLQGYHHQQQASESPWQLRMLPFLHFVRSSSVIVGIELHGVVLFVTPFSMI